MTRVFVLLFSLLLLACSHAEQRAAVPVGATVLVLGDSISYGTGANAGEDYPTLLAAKTGWNIINAGVPGDTTEMALARLPELLEAHSPKLVLVELGGNDFLHHVPRTQTMDNLKKMLAMMHTKQIPTVMLAIPKVSLLGAVAGNLSDDPMFVELGKETDTPVISDEFSSLLGQSELKSDQVHLNALGYQKLAEALTESLKAQGFLR